MQTLPEVAGDQIGYRAAEDAFEKVGKAAIETIVTGLTAGLATIDAPTGETRRWGEEQYIGRFQMATLNPSTTVAQIHNQVAPMLENAATRLAERMGVADLAGGAMREYRNSQGKVAQKSEYQARPSFQLIQQLIDEHQRMFNELVDKFIATYTRQTENKYKRSRMGIGSATGASFAPVAGGASYSGSIGGFPKRARLTNQFALTDEQCDTDPSVPACNYTPGSRLGRAYCTRIAAGKPCKFNHSKIGAGLYWSSEAAQFRSAPTMSMASRPAPSTQ